MKVITTGRAKSMPAGLAIGCGISILVTLIVAGVGAKLMDTGTLKEAAIGYTAMAGLLSASFLGCVVAVAQIKHQKLLVCGLAGLAYFLVLLSMTALLFGGQYTGIGVTALMIASGSGIAAMLSAGQGRSAGKKGGRKWRHR